MARASGTTHAIQAARAGRRTLCGQWYQSPTRPRRRPEYAEHTGDPHAEVSCAGYRRVLAARQSADRPAR